MGEMPRARNGSRLLRRRLRQSSIVPAIRTSPTAESTVPRVMASVRLLPIPESPASKDPETAVVAGVPVEVVMLSVGMVSVSRASLDVCRTTVLLDLELPASGEGVVPEAVPGRPVGANPAAVREGALVGPDTGSVSVVVVVVVAASRESHGRPFHPMGSTAGPARPAKGWFGR